MVAAARGALSAAAPAKSAVAASARTSVREVVERMVAEAGEVSG